MLNVSQRIKLGKDQAHRTKMKKLSKDKSRARHRSISIKKKTRQRSKKRGRSSLNLNPLEKMLAVVKLLDGSFEKFKEISSQISKRNKLFFSSLTRKSSRKSQRRKKGVELMQAQIIEKINLNYKEVNEAFKQVCICLGDFLFQDKEKPLKDFLRILLGEEAVHSRKNSLHRRIDKSRRKTGTSSGTKKKMKTSSMVRRKEARKKRGLSGHHVHRKSSVDLIGGRARKRELKIGNDISAPNFGIVRQEKSKMCKSQEDIFGKRRKSKFQVNTRHLQNMIQAQKEGKGGPPFGEEEGDNSCKADNEQSNAHKSYFSAVSYELQADEIYQLGLAPLPIRELSLKRTLMSSDSSQMKMSKSSYEESRLEGVYFNFNPFDGDKGNLSLSNKIKKRTYKKKHAGGMLGCKEGNKTGGRRYMKSSISDF